MTSAGPDAEPRLLTPGAAHSNVMGNYLAYASTCVKYPVNDELTHGEIDAESRRTGSQDYLHAGRYMTLLEHTANRVYVLAAYMRDNHVGTTGYHGRRQRVTLAAVLSSLAEAQAALSFYHLRYPDKLAALTGRLFETDWKELERQILAELPGRDPNEPDELT